MIRKNVRFQGLFLAAAMMTATVFADEASKTSVVHTADLTLGSISFSYKDSAGSAYWTPVVLNGSGLQVRIFHQRENRSKLQAIGLDLDSIGDFSYDTGAREIRLPSGNRFSAFGLEYGLTFFLLRDVLFKNLDLGIGPRLRLEYQSFKRLYAPDIAAESQAGHINVLVASSARFRLTRSLRLEAEFSGGLVCGLSKQTHSVSGKMPLYFSGGWQTGPRIKAGFLLGSRIAISLAYEYQARFMGWTWGSPYDLWRGFVSLSLDYALGRFR